MCTCVRLKVAMLIRKRFDHTRLRGIAERATARAPLPNTQCTYLQHDAPVHNHTFVSFEWQLQVGVRQYQQQVRITATNTSMHGVAMPESWHTALVCSSLDEIADRFAVEQSAKLGL